LPTSCGEKAGRGFVRTRLVAVKKSQERVANVEVNAIYFEGQRRDAGSQTKQLLDGIAADTALKRMARDEPRRLGKKKKGGVRKGVRT